MITMLLAALDNVIIKRYNADRSSQEQLKVRFIYAPKERVLFDIIDKAQTIQLPVVAITNGGFQRDPSRVFNKIQGSYVASTALGYAQPLPQPMPIDLNINVTILTRYQRDFDQICSMLAYCDPYIALSWRTPSAPDEEIRSLAHWSGGVNTTYPVDIASSQVARVEGTTAFVIKGWLFKSAPTPGDALIYNIMADLATIQDLTTQYALIDSTTTERVMISGLPQPHYITPYFTTVSAEDVFSVVGDSFLRVSSVSLSSNTQILTASFTAIDYNHLTFQAPLVLPVGKWDVILTNPAGSGTLIEFSPSNLLPFANGIDCRDPLQ
jgi:hypothetical protein